MADRPAPPPRRLPLYLAALCLGIGILLPMLTGTYVRTDPELAGVPFFFWYQFLLVVITVILTTIAYRLVVHHERERRRSEGESR